MRKIFLLTAAPLLLLASCILSDGAGIDGTDDGAVASLTIRIVDGKEAPFATRLVEPAASTELDAIQNGYVFIIKPGVTDALSTVVPTSGVELNVAEATGDGQVVAEVHKSSKVFILANIPDWSNSVTKDAVKALSTLEAIKAYGAAISTQEGKYSQAALANRNGTLADINVTASLDPTQTGTATADVYLKPVYSRIEIGEIVGSGDIKSFTVAGVYIDGYYPDFTFGGGYSGTVYDQASTSWAGIGDTAGWTAATDGEDRLVAAPVDDETPQVWGYNVPSGNLPQIVVKLTDVVTSQATSPVPFYLTISTYKYEDSEGVVQTVDKFDPGVIYTLPTIEFTENSLALTPIDGDIGFGGIGIVNDPWGDTPSDPALQRKYVISFPAVITGGTVSSDPAEAMGKGVNFGTEVTLTATPEDGWDFAGWTATDTDGNPYTLTLIGDGAAMTDATITFSMPEESFNLTPLFTSALATLTQTDGGTISVSGNSTTSASMTFTATPSAASGAFAKFFVEWNIVGTTLTGTQKYQNPLTITVSTPTAVSATFDGGVLFGTTIWARANVDAAGTFAASPIAYGKLYQWGNVTAYDYSETTAMSGHSTATTDWDPADGALCPSGWRLPTGEEWSAMLGRSNDTDTGAATYPNTVAQNGNSGGNAFYTGPMGYGLYLKPKSGDADEAKLLFFPAAGGRDSGSTGVHRESFGHYWLSKASSSTNAYANYFDAGNLMGLYYNNFKSFASSVRCVR